MGDAFSTFYGNTILTDTLRAAIRLQRLPHAVVLKGPRGTGKRTLARILAAAAVCASDERPCGACDACRKALAGVHPDITIFSGEKEITADDMRSARKDLFIRPNEAESRALVIENAERMNRFAANALLAVLEEPPAPTVFVLTVENEASLLPTIRSRCAVYGLRPLSSDELNRALLERAPDASSDERARAAAQAGGNLWRALSLLSEGEGTADDPAPRFLRALAAKRARDVVLFSKEVEGKKQPELLAFFTRLKEAVAGALRAANGLPSTPEERDAAGRFSTSALLRLAARIDTLLLHSEYRVGAGNLAGEFLAYCMEALTGRELPHDSRAKL